MAVDNYLFREQAILHNRGSIRSAPLFQQEPLLRYLVGFSLLLAITAVLLLAVIDHRETEFARGILVPSQGSHRVIAPVAAVVSSIEVAAGQSVIRGQILASLSTSRFDHAGKRAEEADITQLQRQLQWYKLEKDLLQSRYQHSNDTGAILVEDLRHSLQLVESESKLQDQQLQLFSTNLAAMERLFRSAAIPQAQLDQAAIEQLSLEIQQQESAQRRQSIQTQLDRQLAAQRGNALEFEQSALQLFKSIQQLEFQIEHGRNESTLTVVAEEAGTIAAIAIEVGQPVVPSQALFYIHSGAIDPQSGSSDATEPGQDELIATLYVPARLFGKLFPGQQLLLSYDAFDKLDYGRYRASITSIDQASLDPREHLLPLPGIREPVFKVSADLHQAYVEGSDIYRLQAGTLFSADIVLAEMSLLEFIFKPLLQLRTRVS